MVIAGFHDFSSSRIERHTVPDGYTLGWNRGGENLPMRGQLVRGRIAEHSHFGGFDG